MNKKIISDIFVLLSHKEKVKLILLAGLMSINAMTEVLGIASVAPLIVVITDPNSVDSIPFLKDIYNYMQFENTKQLSVLLSVCVLFLVVVNNVFSLLTNYLLLRYANDREKTISYMLLKTYLYQDYLFFLNQNSATLLRNVFNEVAYIASNIITRSLMLFSRLISACTIILLIFFVNPQVTLIMAVILGGAYGIIYFLVKAPLYRMGEEYVSLTEEKLRTITDSIKLIKNIKMHSAEDAFLSRFKNVAERYSDVRTKSDIIGIAPRYVMEIFAVAALVVAIIYMVYTTEKNSVMLSMLGVYAFAGFRLMPSLQLIFNSLSKIQFSKHSLSLIAEEIRSYQECASKNILCEYEAIPFTENFGLDSVSFSYDGDKHIISDINLNVNKGQRIGIVGKSASGKSTLIDMLVGLMPPQQGALYVDGSALNDGLYKSWRQNIAYTAQAPYLLDETIEQNISLSFSESDFDDALMQTAIKTACIDFTIDNGQGNNRVGENGQRLSGGQKQRIGIARAIYQNLPILILDEATSALDTDTEKRILEQIKVLNKTMVMISHRVETLQFCDQIYVVSNGKIIASGTFSELLEGSPDFNELLKEDIP